jgi:hypothetical protein
MRFFHPLGAEGPGGAKIAGDRRDQQAFAIGSSSARKVCDDGLTDVGDHGLLLDPAASLAGGQIDAAAWRACRRRRKPRGPVAPCPRAAAMV